MVSEWQKRSVQATGNHRRQRRILGMVRLSCVMVWCLGCGAGSDRGYITHEEELLPVSGQVMFEGKPASNATVVLYRTEAPPPIESDSETTSNDPPLNPRGTCDRNGKFQLFTYAIGDGAPAGDYLVTVSWQDPEGRGRDENYPELLPRRYQNPKTSGLKVQITEGMTALPNFDLKR